MNARGMKGSLRLAIAALIAACIFALCAVLPQNAWAAPNPNCSGDASCNHEAAINSTHYDTLVEAAKAANSGDTVKLLKDIEHSPNYDYLDGDKYFWVRKNITIDLDSHILSSSNTFVLGVSRNASVVVKNGSLTGGTTGGAYVTAGNLEIDNCTITTEGGSSPAIFSFGKNVSIHVKDSKAIGKNCYAVYHNGSFEGFDFSAENAELTSNVYASVYISGSSDTTAAAGRNQQASFTNCTITGATGIEGKFTDIALTGCTVTATAKAPTFEQFNNGSTTDGFAVVSTDNSMKPDSPAPSAKITIDGGTYTGLVGLSQLVNTTDYPDFKEAAYEISGGTFSSDPSAYLVAGHVTKVDPDSYTVMTKSELKPGTYKTVSGEKIEAENLAADSCPSTIAESSTDTYAIGEHKAANDKKDAKAASCIEEGYTGDVVCSACDAVMVKGEVIPTTDHEFSGGRCSVCGIIDPTYATINVTVAGEDGVSTSEQATAEQVAAATASSVVQAVLGVEGATDPVKAGIVNVETYEAVEEAVDAGIAIDVVIKTKPISVEAVPAADKEKIAAVVDNGTIAEYLDLSVMLMADGKQLGAIHKLEKPVEFTVTIPSDLVKDGRTFYVVRVHDGVAEKLPTTVADGFATFKTDRFSTYALAYEDAQAVENGQASTSAQTGDATPLAVFAALAVVALTAIVSVIVCRMRRTRP